MLQVLHLYVKDSCSSDAYTLQCIQLKLFPIFHDPVAMYTPIPHSCPTELLIHLPKYSLKCFHSFSIFLFLRHMIHVLQLCASAKTGNAVLSRAELEFTESIRLEKSSGILKPKL